MDNRASNRTKIRLTSYISKDLPSGSSVLMQFISKDLSEGGIFISTEDMSVFDLGEEVKILVDDNGDQLFKGNAKIVRSVRMFSEEGECFDSGYGLKFQDLDDDFKSMLVNKTAPEPVVEHDDSEAFFGGD